MMTSACVLRSPLLRRVAELVLLVLLASSIGADFSVAQSPAPKPAGAAKLSVVLQGLEKEQQENVEGLLDIWQFNGQQSLSNARIRYLHRKAAEQIESALRPFGYYRSSVVSDLSDLGGKWQAVYRVTAGDQIPVDKLKIEVLGDGSQQQEFLSALQKYPMKSGAPLDQQAYEKLKQSLQSSASQLGYFDAEFLEREIRVDLGSYTADVALVFNTGPRYRLGIVSLDQDVEWLSSQLLAKYNEIGELQYFDARDLQELQSGLSSTEYYSEVQIRASAEDAENLVIPVKVGLKHKNPRQIVYGIGYETDTGVRLKYGLTGRRLNEAGHHYVAEARASQIGFGLAAAYTIPTKDPRTDSYGFQVGYEEEHSDVREYKSLSLGVSLRFRDGFWFKTYSVDYQVEEFELTDSEPVTELLMPSAEWTRTFPTDLDERINTVNGTRLNLRLRGASDSLLSDMSLLQATVSAKWIKTLDSNHRLIGRGSIGTTWVDNFDKLPLSLRYYTGGDATVRGYGYEVVAPLGADNLPLGGRHLIESSIEYEIPFREQWSWVAFADIGDAYNDQPDYRAAIGLGVRWRSPIGPVRFDLGRSLDDPGQGNYRVHFSLGPDL